MRVLKCGRGALLAAQDATQPRPTGAGAVLTQTAPYHLHELAGDNGNEEAPFGAVGLAVIEGC